MAPNPLLRSQAAASAQKFVRRDVRRRHRVQRPRGNADVSSAGVERPRGADWCDRIGGLRGVACGHLRDADEDVGVPRGARAPRPVGTGPEGPIGAIVSGA